MKFELNRHMIKVVEAQCKKLTKNGLSFVFQKWQEWWTKYIALEEVILKRSVYILTNKYIFQPIEHFSHYNLNSPRV